jgi:hypothetical protein
MQKELEGHVLKLVSRASGGTIAQTPPDWLVRPGRNECGRRWSLICEIYQILTGQELPETMPTRERRRPDGILKLAGANPRIIEIDETQHFNSYRALTLRLYPSEIPIAFDPKAWIERSEAKERLEGGGWGKPKPPLFDQKWGRHRQRAFRDALCDVLPPDHGFLPTLRIAYFEVEGWIKEVNARQQMEDLLDRKMSNPTAC